MMKLKNAQHVAFELWCIIEHQQHDGESVEGIAMLFDLMRQRHPEVSEALIHQGFNLLAAKKFAEFEQRLILRRQMAYAGLSDHLTFTGASPCRPTPSPP